MKTRATVAVGLIIAALAMAQAAQAAVIYSETFDANSSDMLGDYGYSQTGLTPDKYTAAGGEALVQGSTYKMWTSPAALASYQWTDGPLTLSADVNSNQGGVGPAIGIFLSSGTSTPVDGFGWVVYWPSEGNHTGMIGPPDQSPWKYLSNVSEIKVSIPGNTSTMYNLSLSVRQNNDNADLFDALVQVNGIAQANSTSNIGYPMVPATVVDGWVMGLSKADYGIGGTFSPFESLGLWGDGSGTTQRYDNVTLSVIPEPATFGLFGVAAIAMLLRRRLRG